MAGRSASRNLKLQDAAALFEALRGPSIKLREAVLRAVERDPAGALGLGTMQGWDVVDELVHQSYQSCSVPYYRALMRALSAFDDPRVEALFAKVAQQASDPDILALVARIRAGGTADEEPRATPASAE